MSPRLLYQDSRSVVFRDDTYRWVDEASFTILDTTAQTSTSEVLQALLVDDHYVDAYQLADKVASDVHGRKPGPTQYENYLTSLTSAGLTPATDPMRTAYPDLWERCNRPGPDHGPYVLSAISLGTFDQLDGPRVRRTFYDWLADDDEVWPYPRPSDIEGDLDGIVADLATAETVFRLHDLGEAAEHATGWIVQPYLELICFDLAAHQLRLVAGGED